MGLEKIKGYIERIVYRNSQNGYTVLSVEADGGSTVCVGILPWTNEGEYMEFSGEFCFHPKFGEQFKVNRAEVIQPEDINAIEKYLGSGAIRGIGTVTAHRIIEKFGDDALRIMDEEPERLAEIKGISMKKALEIASAQEEKKDLRSAMIFMGDYGISNNMAVKLYGQYGPDIYSIIRENPYQLSDEVSGIGFRKADEIAFNVGVDPGSDYRIKAGIVHVLQAACEQGHVYLPDNILKEQLLETLRPRTVDDICEIEEGDINRCIMDLAIDSRIIIKKNREKTVEDYLSENDGTASKTSGDWGQRQIYTSENYYTELGIARKMMDINLNGGIPEEEIEKRIKKVEKKSEIILDELQREAVRAAANSGVLIITGGPGTGKTTTINALLKFFEDDYKKILLAAPTGRAAKRMTEATGYEAKTIHRMLELSNELSDTSRGARFNKNEDDPLEADLVIVDEMSMVDIFLMSALVRAVRPGTRLILVGDVDQLPSVGPGNVLHDLIESDCFKTVKLNKIFRQAEESDIVVNAHKINHGEKIELKTDSKDFIFLKRTSPQAVASVLLALIKDKLPKYVNADMREIQVLTPMKRGSLGVVQLNAFLQQSLNPPAPNKKELPVRDQIFREGDKVMHIKNNYDLGWEMRTASGFVYDKGTGIFNGDIGIIEKINEQRSMIEVAFDDGKYAIYEFEQLEELTLSYAATIHKSQGSEYPAVILPLLSGPPILMNRNILYTAVTRAKSCVVVVGSDDVVLRMIENTREQERYTGLRARLMEINHIK